MNCCKLLVTLVGLFSIASLSGMQSESSAHAIPTTANQIVYVIASPRSGLVEFLRMAHGFGKYKIMHIPANWAYCIASNNAHLTKGWYREDAPATYEKALEDILSEAQKAPVLVGENTHTAYGFLQQSPEFVKKARFIFLIAHPHGPIISYYKKKEDMFDQMKTSQISESIGFKGLYDFMQELKRQGHRPPLVIQSEELYFNGEQTVQSICDYLAIPFKKEYLQWKDLGKRFMNFSDYGWYTIETTKTARDWHMLAIRSSNFSMPAFYALDEQKNPTFEEIKNQKHRDICIKAYEENIVYYHQLLRESK